MRKATRYLATGATVAIAGLVMAGCAPASAPEADGKVTIFGGYGEVQAAGFQKALDTWGAANGIEIEYTSLASFDTDIKVKIEAGQTPDLGLFPQPGGLVDQAEAENILPLNSIDGFDISVPEGTLVPGWETLAALDGDVYGLPVSASVKTLVWYSPPAFAKNGYEVPTTDAELTALTAKIKADGSGYPFCAGIESGGATGWPMTDWIEQYVLDYNGVEVYDKWIAGDVTFDSPEVTKAADKVSELLLADGQVNGGGVSMATDGFGNTAALFETGGKAKGQCFMIRQGSFITDFFPDAIKAEVLAGDNTTADVFPLPAPAGAQSGVLGGGDLVAAFHNDSDVGKVLQFITSDQLGGEFAIVGGFVSPHKTFDTSQYPNELTKTIGETMANAEVFGFDGSDRMPSAVNAEFWVAATEWVVGRITWEEAAGRIQSKY